MLHSVFLDNYSGVCIVPYPPPYPLFRSIWKEFSKGGEVIQGRKKKGKGEEKVKTGGEKGKREEKRGKRGKIGKENNQKGKRGKRKESGEKVREK